MRTVGELLELLQDLCDADPAAADLPLRIAIQPNWPLNLAVRGVAAGRVVCSEPAPDKPVLALFLVAAESAPWDENPYADRELWDRCEDDPCHALEALRREEREGAGSSDDDEIIEAGAAEDEAADADGAEVQ